MISGLQDNLSQPGRERQVFALRGLFQLGLLAVRESQTEHMTRRVTSAGLASSDHDARSHIR
jgi:hypothetical protein